MGDGGPCLSLFNPFYASEDRTMNRTVIIGSCLGLSLASHAAAEQISPRSRNVHATATVVQSLPTGGSARLPAQADDDESAPGNRRSVFTYPPGLSMSAESLFARLGQIPAHCVPMTSDTTYDLAFACFIRGMYADAIVFASHGLTLRDDARLHLIKGVCEMHLGRCAEAEATVEQYLNAISHNNLYGLAVARERINGPMRVHFEQIIKHISSMATVRPGVIPG